MNKPLTSFALEYAAALRRGLVGRRAVAARAAQELGVQAAGIGVGARELKGIHARAVGGQVLAGDRAERAAGFLATVLRQRASRRAAARSKTVRLVRLNLVLRRRTRELAATRRQLQRGVARRKQVEQAFRTSNQEHARLLKEALRRQESLRQLTRRVLAAQEEERRSVTHELQDEVAQTLLGINVRLLALRQEAGRKTAALRAGLASTQRLVATSTRSVRRTGRKLGRA
jgi:signal transduction histidine kinase